MNFFDSRSIAAIFLVLVLVFSMTMSTPFIFAQDDGGDPPAADPPADDPPADPPADDPPADPPADDPPADPPADNPPTNGDDGTAPDVINDPPTDGDDGTAPDDTVVSPPSPTVAQSCEVRTDADGCIVKTCSDGQYSRDCPEGPSTGSGSCPDLSTAMPPSCSGEGNYIITDDFDNRGCHTGWHCEYTETSRSTAWCPTDNTCYDGSKPCQWIGDKCKCETCPAPPGCWNEVDPNTGYEHYVCGSGTRNCPSIPEDEEIKCKREGGTSIRKMNNAGCDYIVCEFWGGGGNVSSNPFRPQECPSDEEIKRSIQKCENMGMKGVRAEERGCKIGRCVNDKEKEDCKYISWEIEKPMIEECNSQGMAAIKQYDSQGCVYLKCADTSGDFCMNIPEEKYKRCEEDGGELITNKDNRGCITWHECVMRGDERDVYYEEIDEVPDGDVLLSIAFKLEELKMKFEELSIKSMDIAKFYSASGSSEAERFKRVSAMFKTAMQKIDDIKINVRNRIDSLNKGDVEEFKHDIKYIKEVMLKDIVYVMLSSGDDVRGYIEQEDGFEIDAENVGGCGYDGNCFDESFRICQPTTFRPDNEATLEIIGVEGDNCKMIVRFSEVPPGMEPTMTCFIPDYSFGLNGPDDMIPHCVGPMADFLKANPEMMEDGGSSRGGEPGDGPGLEFGGPGGCRTKNECDEFCAKQENWDECQRFKNENQATQPEIFNNRDDGSMNRNYGPQPGISGETVPCSGCLNNGLCDPGECEGCPDCMMGGRPTGGIIISQGNTFLQTLLGGG